MALATAPRGEGSACRDPDENPPEAQLSPAALRVLLENRHRFLGFLERRLGRRDLAEEVLQDAFVRGIVRGGALRDDESTTAWFYRLLRNALIDRVRAEAAERRGRAAFAEEAQATGEGEGRADPELMEAICTCVGTLVETLRPEYAAAIRRVELGSEPLPAYAAAEGITRGNAAVRLFRARQALRRRIEQSCGTCATHGGYACECQSEPHPAGLP